MEEGRRAKKVLLLKRSVSMGVVSVCAHEGIKQRVDRASLSSNVSFLIHKTPFTSSTLGQVPQAIRISSSPSR